MDHAADMSAEPANDVQGGIHVDLLLTFRVGGGEAGVAGDMEENAGVGRNSELAEKERRGRVKIGFVAEQRVAIRGRIRDLHQGGCHTVAPRSSRLAAADCMDTPIAREQAMNKVRANESVGSGDNCGIQAAPRANLDLAESVNDEMARGEMYKDTAGCRCYRTLAILSCPALPIFFSSAPTM